MNIAGLILIRLIHRASAYHVAANLAFPRQRHLPAGCNQDGTDEGTLSEIRRLYVQDGKVIANAPSMIPGVTGSAITDDFCNAQQLGEAMATMGGVRNCGAMLQLLCFEFLWFYAAWDPCSIA